MECVPQFAGDPKVLSCDFTFIKDSFDSLTALFFVSVITSFIDASVTSIWDGVVDGVGNLVLWNFPAAQTYWRHFITAREHKVCLCFKHWLGVEANTSVNSSLSWEWLPWVISHGVVNNTKLSISPLISAFVVVHELSQSLNSVFWEFCVVSKSNCFPINVSLVYPSSVSSNYLIKEGFLAIGWNSDSW